LDAAGGGGDSEFGVNVGELFFGAGGLPDVQRFAVPLLEGGGDPVLLPKRVPQASPTFVDAGFSKFPADYLHRLIGEDGDEEVAIATTFELMIDRAHAELGF
jgi:hypothetical protein